MATRDSITAICPFETTGLLNGSDYKEKWSRQRQCTIIYDKPTFFVFFVEEATNSKCSTSCVTRAEARTLALPMKESSV